MISRIATPLLMGSGVVNASNPIGSPLPGAGVVTDIEGWAQGPFIPDEGPVLEVAAILSGIVLWSVVLPGNQASGYWTASLLCYLPTLAGATIYAMNAKALSPNNINVIVGGDVVAILNT